MAQPARMFEAESSMEQRVAKLEVQADHLREDVRRIETKLDALSLKVEALKDSFTAFQLQMTQGLADFKLEMKDSFSKVQNGRWADKVWWLLIAGAILGVMAHGFKWI